MAHRLSLIGARLLLLGAVLVGCATSQAEVETKVRRAPWISFYGHESVSTQFKSHCGAQRFGPEEAPRKDGISFGRQLMEREVTCLSSTRAIGQAIERQAQETLRRGGYQVGQGTPLVANVFIKMQTKVEPQTRKDTPNSTTCQKVCGRSTCLLPNPAGVIEVKATFSGPRGRAPGMDQVDRVIAIEVPLRAQRGGQSVVCSLGDAARWHDPDRFDWAKAESEVLAWYRGTLQRMLLPYDEEFELSLFEVDAPAEATRALASARAKRWRPALEDYKVALALATDSNAGDKVPRIRLNIATTLMQLGELDAALSEARRAKTEGQLEEADALIQEIERRIADRAKTS